MNPTDSLVGLEPDVDAHIRGILDRAAAIRLPELFASRPPEALYWVGDRHGVSTVALRTTSLTPEQLRAIMTYRLAQYLMAHQIDPRLIHQLGIEQEPLTGAAAQDVHCFSVDTEGTILCYATLKTLAVASDQRTLASKDRPLFPVESVFGAGLYRHFKILRDLPISRIREIGRFAKNHFVDPLNELIVRGPVETGLAVMRLASQALHSEVDACIGDLEEGIGKKNFDFFHVPSVLIHGVIPFAAEGTFGFFNYQYRTRYPFALLSAEIPASRLDKTDEALSKPGKEGIVAILAMKKEPIPGRSSLESPAGLLPLADAVVPDQGGPMAARRELLDVGEWLRTTTLFRELSVAEAAVLGTFLDRVSFEPGAFVVRQGDPGDDVYLIEHGTADTKLTTPDGRYLKVRELGPRDYFGEIALIAGGERTADVIATTPLTLLRLSHDAYERYLARLVEVERDLTKTALTRSHDTLRTIGRERS